MDNDYELYIYRKYADNISISREIVRFDDLTTAEDLYNKLKKDDYIHTMILQWGNTLINSYIRQP